MMSKVLGLKTYNLSSTLFHATRYSPLRLVSRAMKCFPNLDDYRIEEETFQQFRDLMTKGEH